MFMNVAMLPRNIVTMHTEMQPKILPKIMTSSKPTSTRHYSPDLGPIEEIISERKPGSSATNLHKMLGTVSKMNKRLLF